MRDAEKKIAVTGSRFVRTISAAPRRPIGNTVKMMLSRSKIRVKSSKI